MEVKLSDEQVEKACETFYNALPGSKWAGFRESIKVEWRAAIQKAAPYLQAPIAEPTEEEARIADQEQNHFLECGHDGPVGAMLEVLREFVARRNAPAKPDKRREVVMAEITRKGLLFNDVAEDLCDRIRAALDAEVPDGNS